MDEIITIENRVDENAVRHVHLMSNTPFGVAAFPQMQESTEFGGIKGVVTREQGVWHFRAESPMRGLIEIKCEGWPEAKRFVVWSLVGCLSVTEALYDAAKEFERICGQRPGYAFMWKLPKGIENAHAIGDLNLFEAEWMINKSVAVGWMA